MPESRFDRSEQRHPELHHFKLSRSSNGRKERGLVNYHKKFNNEFDARLQSVQSQEKQQPIFNLYSKTNFKPKSTFTSQMHPRFTRLNVRKNLGHDLDQLTIDNHHEVSLSPHPSLTIMVQPNKIDYSERGVYIYHLLLDHSYTM